MIRYAKELIIFVLQLFIFYILPLFADPTDMMGMVLLIILATLLLSIMIGVVSNKKVKYLYPVVTAVVFIPSVFIYYNKTALIHSVWYLVLSAIGLAVGSGINALAHKSKQKK